MLQWDGYLFQSYLGVFLVRRLLLSVQSPVPLREDIQTTITAATTFKPVSHESLVSSRSAYTLEPFPFCIPGVTASPQKIFGLWTGQVPTHSRGPLVCICRGKKYPSLVVSPECVAEGGSKQITELCINGEEQRDPGSLLADIRAVRFHSAASHLAVGRILGKLSDPLDLGTELSVLPSNKPHTAEQYL
jgi:hypothetical protein